MEWITEGWVIAVIVGGALAAVGLFYAARYEKVGPNEVLIVSGRRGVYESASTLDRCVKNFRIYHGGGTFVWPVREKVDRMSVELMTLEILTPEFFTKSGVPMVVDAIAQIKVRSDDPIATATAAEMFLSKGRDEMNEIAHQMMQGHLRGVISTLPLEEIHANPEAFAQSVQRLTAEDLANMGIQVVSFTIREVRDPSGFLTALGRPQLADVRKNAVLGEANAERDSTKGKAIAQREATVTAAQAQQESQLAEIARDVAVAEAEKSKGVKVNQFAAEVAQAKAQSDLAYDLQKAKTEQLVVEEQLGVNAVEREKRIEVDSLEIERKEKELMHSVRKPAEAEQFRIETLAAAERGKLRLVAEGEAEGQRLRGLADADVIRAKGEAEAEIIRQKALAEADGMRARYAAEADGMRQKAAAWKEYTSAAIAEILIDRMPDIAAAVAQPLEKIDRIVMVSSDGNGSSGVERVTGGLTKILAQVPAVTEMLGGVDLKELIRQIPGTARASGQDNGQDEPAKQPVPTDGGAADAPVSAEPAA